LAHAVRPLRRKPLRHRSVDRDAAAGQAISACGGDAPKTLNGLIAANTS
jgi:hypothetical protein